MANEQPLEIETDGDPSTLYEDLQAHERTGFFVNDKQHPDETAEAEAGSRK